MSGVQQGNQAADRVAALLETEERLRLVQATGRIGSLDCDLRTGFVFRSPEYLTLQGMSPDEPQAGFFSDQWLSRLHPDDRVQVEAWTRVDMSAPCEFEREYRILLPDSGTVRWIHNRGRVEGDADGRPIRLVSVQTDVTARKLGELRSAYVASLSEVLQRAASPRAAMQAATEHLGRYLGASQVGYAEVDDTETWFDVLIDWTSGEITSLVGRYRLADFGDQVLARVKGGRLLLVENVATHDIQGDESTRHAALKLGVVSALDLPLVRDGRLVALLGVHQTSPRRWSDQDIEIVRITAERTRDAVVRARAEEALLKSEERMRLAIAGTGLGSYDIDMVTGEGIWSDTAFALLGLEPRAGGIARHGMWAKAVHPDDLARSSAIYARAKARGGAWELENRIIRADDGRVRWLHTYGQIIGDPHARRSVGIVIDTTERKEAELRQAFMLRLSDTLRSADDSRIATRAVAEMVAQALGVDTAVFVQIESDRMTATILSGFTKGVRPGSLTVDMGRDHARLRAVAIPDLIAGRPFVVHDLRTDPRTADHAEEMIAASGASALIHAPMMREGRIGALLFVNSAEPRHWSESDIQLVQDVAERTWEAIERVRAERALRAANKRLADDIETAVTARETALAQLHQAQKLETIGQLTGGIAHDFNNLLTPITGALDLLRHRFQSDERLARLIGGAQQSAERARTLVQRLLGFARQQPLTPVATDLPRLLEGMRDLIVSSVGRAIDTRIEIEPGLPCALIDVNQLELALLNLCVNARDAMPAGGTLTIRAARGEGPGPAEAGPGSYVKLSVHDDGIGMDAETARRAIEPFFSTKPMERGTGLGLSMVHGLAGQLGGALAIDSTPGIGTRIDLWLPAAAPDAAPAPPSSARTIAAVRPLSILVVDDEDLVRIATVELLRDLGHRVVAVTCGAEALEKLAGEPGFDAVLTDYKMPAMDGVELAERIAIVAPGLPVLLITGFVGTDERAGKLPRLTKPFGRNDLTAALSSLMSR